MKNIQIIGDDVYYKNVLVAKLILCKNYTVQGDFIDEINVDYEKKYDSLVDTLPTTDDLDEIEKFLDQIETKLHSLRESFDYMYSNLE